MNRRPTARRVVGLFFPQRPALGIDSRDNTPGLVRVAMHVASEVRSFDRAAVLLGRIVGNTISAKTIERLVGQVGGELRQRLVTPAHEKIVVVPAVAVVCSDGGRLQTREPGHGPGVHAARWRETKNASFERMQAPKTSGQDPCEALPDTFRKVVHVAKIAEMSPFAAEDPGDERAHYEGPQRILRTCLSSLVCSDEFGVQMHREAQRRRFFEAGQRVYIGDGLAWNWSIWKEHFPTFTPILDFIHAVQYLYAAAKAWETDDSRGWARYLELAEQVWRGSVGEVVRQLREELARRGIDPEDDLPDDSPHQPLIDAARYLENNQTRMDYPAYRRAGLPITSAPMESLIKQINLRVKGTEMFWNDPSGAEAILQLRAAGLCEDSRLDDYLRTRPGSAITRRPSPAAAA